MPTSQPLTLPVPSEALIALAAGASAGISNRIATMAEQQKKAEKDAPAVMAQSMLSLIEGISDFDNHSASHLLIGLLRLAAKQPLLTVERTALRIAGLVEPEKDTLKLTTEGKSLLSMIGSTEIPTAAAAEAVAAAPEMAGNAPDFDPSPFATMRFGDQVFEVADGPVDESLAFRVQGDDAWQVLSADRTSGWDVIGGEMLERTRDAVADYIMMHTVRLPDEQRGAGVHRFELDQWIWFIRVQGDVAEIAIGENGEWQEIHSRVQESTIRDLGMRAAIAMIPEFVEGLQTEVTIWLRRMAHAASISPVMSSAA